MFNFDTDLRLLGIKKDIKYKIHPSYHIIGNKTID
jgi:hypothetical protein